MTTINRCTSSDTLFHVRVKIDGVVTTLTTKMLQLHESFVEFNTIDDELEWLFPWHMIQSIKRVKK